MAVVSLTLFKQHVRADEFADDDTYMQHLLDTAEEAVIAATNRTDSELRAMGEGGNAYPKRLEHAIMMVAAHWYNQRESVAGTQMHEVPDALQALIKPLRKLAE